MSFDLEKCWDPKGGAIKYCWGEGHLEYYYCHQDLTPDKQQKIEKSSMDLEKKKAV